MTLPRVSEILAEAGLGPTFDGASPAVLKAARDRGVKVHAAIEAHHYGYPFQLAEYGEPYYNAYLKFLAETGHEPIISEAEVIHPAWKYVGHPDRIGWLTGRRGIIDYKCSDAPDLTAAGRQLAGYFLAWNAAHPTIAVQWAGVLQLKRAGVYRFHDITPVLPHHEKVFLAALVVYRERHGVIS